MTANELKQIIEEMDYDGNHMINYSEFLAATVSVQNILTHARLEALFKQFDVEDKNEISGQNIRDAMTKMGREVSDKELDEIMKRHDITGDKAISFEEFKNMMLTFE